MSEPPHRSPAPLPPRLSVSHWLQAPAVTVVAIVCALAFLLANMLRLPGWGAGGLAGLELFFDLVVVLLGFMSVALSLHTLEPEPDRRVHLLAAGIAVAAVANFLHAMLLQAFTASPAPAGPQDMSAFYGLCARLVESLAWSMYAFGLRMRGRGTLWAAGACVLALVLAWLGAGPLPARLALASEPGYGLGLQWLSTACLVAAALMLWRGRHLPGAGRDRGMAWSAAVLGLAQLVALLPSSGWPQAAELVSHGLRVVAYALLFQAMYTSGIRQPFLRAREIEAQLRDSEMRLHLLGRNLPDSVTYQLLRDHDGRRRFVYMGEAVERLVGVRAEDALRDPALLYDRIQAGDRVLNDRVEEESFQLMRVSDNVVRVVRTDGQVRWIRMSSSPRPLPDGRVIWDGVATDVTEQREHERLARRRGAQLDGLLRNLPGGVARIGSDLRLLYVNPLQAQWLGTDVGALEGQLLGDVLPPVVLAQAMPHLQRALAGHTAVFENRIDYADGPQFRHTTFAPEFGPDGGVVAVVSFAYDLTAQRRLASELDQQRGRLAVLVNSIPDMVSLKDADGRYLLANPAFERWIGRPERDIVGQTDDTLWPPAEALRMRELDARAMAAWHPLVVEEDLTLADGGTCCFETIKTPIRDAQGRVTGLLGVCRDITDRKRAEQEIERLAFYDALTSLPNRRLLLDRLQRATAASQRHGRPGALLFIDLDNFKDLNDTLGHDMGDRLLAQVAQRLVGCVGATDTVARFGGDEFVVMLEDLDPSTTEAAAQAEQLAERLLVCLNEPFALGAQQHFSTPSIGITLFGDQPCSVDELLKRADLAMYQAKAAGRNTQRFFDPNMQAHANARSHLEADLRQGLARGELCVHYQPIVDGRTRICGAEALVRWPHPERGMISPVDFIPLAEQTGLILPLGRFVLKSACEQLVRWSRHADTRHLTVSVNVSARQFRQPGFVGEVLDVLRDTGAEPRRLKLELTESMLLGDIEDTIGRMSQLKSEGVGFSLDDFGTGYSSLSYLKRLPLDQVKIDQGFVRDVLTDPNDAAIVRTILALADSLDLNVVAEGVETAGQLSFLKLHGCNGFQGYLFGRPGPAQALEAAMASTA